MAVLFQRDWIRTMEMLDARLSLKWGRWWSDLLQVGLAQISQQIFNFVQSFWQCLIQNLMAVLFKRGWIRTMEMLDARLRLKWDRWWGDLLQVGLAQISQQIFNFVQSFWQCLIQNLMAVLFKRGWIRTMEMLDARLRLKWDRWWGDLLQRGWVRTTEM